MDNTASSQNWPGAFGAYKPSKEAILRSLATIVWLFVINFLTGVIAGVLFRRVILLEELVIFAVGAYTSSAVILTVLSSVRGKRLEIDEALRNAWPYTLYMFLLNILLVLIYVVIDIPLVIFALVILFLTHSVVAAIATFVVLALLASIIILPRLSLANYALIDKKLNPGEAVNESWKLTKNNVGKVWGVFGVTILILLPIVTIIGILLSVYLIIMYYAAFGLLYVYLSHTQQKAPELADPKPAS